MTEPREKDIQPISWPITVARNGKPFHNLAGVRFGRLTALNIGNPDKRGHTRWSCKCACGSPALVAASDLITGHTKSCGCEKIEKFAERSKRNNRKHGHTVGRRRSPEYLSWCAMHQRCYKPRTRSFENYGGRGITVCERWHSFEAFLVDMGHRPDGTSLDRKDVNGNYELSNCKWSIASEQQKSKRANLLEPTEKSIQKSVVDHWRLCGNPNTLVAAIPNQYAHGQPGLTPGLSDLIVFGGYVTIGFLELKAKGGRLSAAQRSFLDLLERVGIRNAVTYGRDQPIALLEQWGIVRRQARSA